MKCNIYCYNGGMYYDCCDFKYVYNCCLFILDKKNIK